MRRTVMSGFTLVETLVAVAIFSASMIAASAALSAALSVGTRYMWRQDAVEEIERQTSVLRSRTLASGKYLSGQQGTYAWYLSLTPLPEYGAGPPAAIIPFHAIGRIRKDGAAWETVFDTILLGQGAP